MNFARRVFLAAGLYGLAVMLPQYFLLERNGRDFPPAITHPEYYYGFVGVAVAWQVAFLIVSRDPVRYRPLMVAAILEKAAFGLPAIVLFILGSLSVPLLAAGVVDLVLGTLFLMAYARTAPPRPSASQASAS